MSTISNSTPANANYTDAAGNAVHKDGPTPADGSNREPQKADEPEQDKFDPFLQPGEPRFDPFLQPGEPRFDPFQPPSPPPEEPYSD